MAENTGAAGGGPSTSMLTRAMSDGFLEGLLTVSLDRKKPIRAA